MAAPSATARQTPSGRRLKNGFKSLITFARAPSIGIWEIAVKPMGFDGGDPVDTTTQHNNAWLTSAPRELIKCTAISGKCAYDPKAKTTLLSLLNIEDTITCRYSDGSTEAAFGFLRTFEPDEMVEGTMPTASFEIEITNVDSSGAEQDPVVVEVAGT